ncbi:MAG: uracil-DNA glycosylase [Thermoproteota archaeon]|nr:uracil-DNA glycosylase [Thermoproteota archaeon]
MSQDKLHWINHKVIGCTRCPRLSQYIKQIGQEKVKRFISEEYWARPLPSWGDPNARLLIVGLAPAAHGGNRTGRMFTGDGSGDWLARAMYQSGFASMPTSRSKDDGLVLKDAYITAAIRCAPPDNKPLTIELMNCSQYLVSELQILKNIKVILMLGKIGFDAYCRAAGLRKLRFSHGASYEINGKMLLASYHPSRQNTNTGKLTWQMWFDIFKKARSILGS